MKVNPVSTLFAAALLFIPLSAARADDDIQGQPAPESADELITSFDRGLEGEAAEPTRLEELLANSTVKLKLRNYYFNRKRPEKDDPLAWAQGGSVEYKVDKVGGIFGLAAEYFGSYKLYAPEDKDGSLLLEPGQNNIDTLGIANPKATYEGQVLSLYRQRIDLPFVNSQDNRMIPITFEAYTLAMPKVENERFQYALGYIAEMKKRNEESFQSMSEVAGVSGKERGMIMGGARYYILPELSLGGINYFVDDVLNIFYTESIYKTKIDEHLANTFSAQLADQRSVGEDLLRGIDYSTGFFGVQNALSYDSVTLKLAYTHDDPGADIRAPYGSYPGYNSSIVEDFNRAGEKTWQIGLAYSFARLGIKGLGISTGYIQGADAVDETTKASLPDKDEADVTIDYKLEEGALKGLWLRMRAGIVGEDGKGTTEDYRIIVNYEIPLYEPETTAG